MDVCTCVRSYYFDCLFAPGKEKKRRRWGAWMGRAAKCEPKGGTLGRARPPPPAPRPLPPALTKETLVPCILLLYILYWKYMALPPIKFLKLRLTRYR